MRGRQRVRMRKPASALRGTNLGRSIQCEMYYVSTWAVFS